MGETLPTVANLRGALATPQSVKTRQILADGIIEIAARLQDWPLLDEAVDIKIADQRWFVEDWWKNNAKERGDPNLTDRVRFPVAQLEAQSGLTEKQVSRWRVSLKDAAAYHDRLVQAARRKAGLEPDINRVTPNSGEEQWFTPAGYIEAARKVMGAIDLDPASHPLAQETVQAGRWYSPENDGLALPWYGRVWLNPPYSFPLIERFAEKLVAELGSGNVSQAIMLTNNCTDTGWFHLAEGPAALLCFTRGRINFYGPNGIGEAPLQGQCFFYFGDREDRFRQYFGQFGFVR